MEEAAEEVNRFKTDVFDEKPTVVIWQVGTNAVWKGYDLGEVMVAIEKGLEKLQGISADIVLMDLQCAPALLSSEMRPRAEQMVSLIAAACERLNVFRRFALMRHWNVEDGIPFEQMISNTDGNQLHQNDWSYDCIAQALANAIVEASGPRTV